MPTGVNNEKIKIFVMLTLLKTVSRRKSLITIDEQYYVNDAATALLYLMRLNSIPLTYENIFKS